jgi:hypothetical protein
VATVKGASTLSYTNTGLTSAKTYSYKVRAYKTSNGNNYYGTYCSVMSMTTKPAKVSTLSLSTKSSAVTLKWSKVARATGYEIYRLNKKTGKYEKIKAVKGASTCSYKNSKLKKKSSYSYKVRAYRTYNGKTYYGSYSAVKKITVK